jgi:hypothetical protein
VVAEAIPEQEEAQAAAVTPEALESIPEPTTETPEAETTDYGSLLESLEVDPSATEPATGAAPTSDSPSNPLEGLTPQQIEERGAQRERERLQRESETTQRQAREDGLNRALPALKESVKQLLAGLDADTVLSVLGKFDEFHGTHLALRQGDVDRMSPQIKSAAYNEAAVFTFEALTAAAKEELGDDAHKALTGTKHESWADVTKHIVKEARKGLVPKEDVTKGQRDLLEKLDKRVTTLAAQGISIKSLKDITGNGGSDLPPIRGGTGGRMTLAQFNNLSIDEQAKVPPAERARIYGSVQ